MYHGIINVYKEKGFTSHDVVAKMRGILGQKKIGHTGTLDPDAEGVLPVCVGAGTKLCDMLTDKSKVYETEFCLGYTTDTQDQSGTVLTQSEVNVTEDTVREVITSFIGTYAQIPPMYSAIKVNGKKLYELARAGVEIERKPRQVEIHGIDILEIRLPFIKMTVSCSKGTYIRTLCYDIGQKLGCGATMEKLTRTKVGPFLLKDAVRLEQLQEAKEKANLSEYVVPVEKIFENYKEVVIKPVFERLLDNGNQFFSNQAKEAEMLEQTVTDQEWVRVKNEKGFFYGIYSYHKEQKIFRPEKIFGLVSGVER